MTINFPNGNQARAIFMSPGICGDALAADLILPPRRALLLLHGGAAGLAEDTCLHLQKSLITRIAEIATNENFTIIDGGTQSGVMQMMGEAYAAAKGTFPLIGICPAACVTWSGKDDAADLTPLEPHHTHFVLTSGDHWGAETETMFSLAATLAKQVPSLALLVNGGAVTRAELRHNVVQGREVVVIAGSGRLADTLAAVVRSKEDSRDEELNALARRGKLSVFDMTTDINALTTFIRARLCGA